MQILANYQNLARKLALGEEGVKPYKKTTLVNFRFLYFWEAIGDREKWLIQCIVGKVICCF